MRFNDHDGTASSPGGSQSGEFCGKFLFGFVCINRWGSRLLATRFENLQGKMASCEFRPVSQFYAFSGGATDLGKFIETTELW